MKLTGLIEHISHLKILTLRKNKRIDGSRITIIGCEDRNRVVYDINNDEYYEDTLVGQFDILKNKIYLNARLFEEKPELMCAVISHEFLHMLLEWDISDDASWKLDNICPTVESAFTNNGGL